jgi:hypothetical protein
MGAAVVESPDIDPTQIAARLRALLVHVDESGLANLASRLSVDVNELRESLDAARPRPTIPILAAVVREFGIDPCWLLTGEYNSQTHYASLEDDKMGASADATRFLMARTSPISAASDPATESSKTDAR